MPDSSGTSLAALSLAIATFAKMQAKNIISSDEAKELLDGMMLKLEQQGLSDPSRAEAHDLLKSLLPVVDKVGKIRPKSLG